jgi:hypothetical protein
VQRFDRRSDLTELLDQARGKVRNVTLSFESMKPFIHTLHLEALSLRGTGIDEPFEGIEKGSQEAKAIQAFREALSKSLGGAQVAAAKKAKPKGFRKTLREIKTALTGSTYASVSQGIALLKEAALPELWDAICAGMDPGSVLVAGEDKASQLGMGGVLGKGRRSDACFARWAALWVLVTAPESARLAVEIRSRIQEVHFSCEEGAHNKGVVESVPELPPMDGFSDLKTLRIRYADVAGSALPSLPATLVHFEVMVMSSLVDVTGLANCVALTTLKLGDTRYHAAGTGVERLESLAGVEKLVALETVHLFAPTLTTLQPLAKCTALRRLRLHRCAALVSLTGIEEARDLGILNIFLCEQLTDFSALAGKPKLGTLGERLDEWNEEESGILDLWGAGTLSNVAFLDGPSSLRQVKLKVSADTDLVPIGNLDQLEFLALKGAAGLSLRGLYNARRVRLELEGAPKGVEAMPSVESLTLAGRGAELTSEWPELPALREVNVEQESLSSLAWLNAPALVEANLKSCQLVNLLGIGHAHQIRCDRFSHASIASLSGLEGNTKITRLNLRHITPDADCSALSSLPNLVELKLSSVPESLIALGGCPSVRWLQLIDFGLAGNMNSLSFLQGWSDLTHILLAGSGMMVDLDVLCGLRHLKVIHLRGSKTNRKHWPEALQTKLDFKSADSTYEKYGW